MLRKEYLIPDIRHGIFRLEYGATDETAAAGAPAPTLGSFRRRSRHNAPGAVDPRAAERGADAPVRAGFENARPPLRRVRATQLWLPLSHGRRARAQRLGRAGRAREGGPAPGANGLPPDRLGTRRAASSHQRDRRPASARVPALFGGPDVHASPAARRSGKAPRGTRTGSTRSHHKTFTAAR